MSRFETLCLPAGRQVFDEGAGRSRLVWLADLLPNELASVIDAMITQGVSAMKKTLETRT